ncbi:MAG TPA: hypothetical protein VF363_05835 [Candidatus Eisenbacteria bacterium]
MTLQVLRKNGRAWLTALGLVALVGVASGIFATPARAVILDDEKRVDLVLADNTNVTLFAQQGGAAPGGGTPYYYLPVNLRLATNPDGTPEFLFLKFTTEKRADQGGVEGGLMHFLMQWGLTPAQETEVKDKLKQKDPKGVLMGAVPVEDEGEGSGSFQIISGTLSDNKMSSALVSSGKAPLVPGGRCAAASRLSPEGAQLLAASFEKTRSIADVSIALNFNYTTIVPAAKGTITFDWSKLETHFDSLGAEYSRKQSGTSKSTASFLGIPIFSSESPEYAYSYNEVKKQFDFLMEKQIVKFDWQENVSDDRITKVREAFLTYFINSMTEPAPQAPPPPPSTDEKKDDPNIRYGTNYKFSKTSLKRAFESKTKVLRLDMRLPIKHQFQIVGNLASWYDGVRDNPKCVAAVNLNDPFYQHRDINFILDLDAKDMFEQEANYVTVNVRKQRSEGNPFEDHVTIDAKYVKDNGINAKMTYARGEDKNADTYQYQAQWSFRGGKVWPTNPPWQTGSWEGVTLAAPIVPRTIEVEGDLDALKASNVARVTAQIHYIKFGTEMEENLSVSPVKNEPLVSKRIYMDADSKGYAYRLIVDSKTDGKLATPWSAKVADDYIFAAVPKDMLEQPDLKAVAKTAALDASTSAKEKVLSKFAELLGGTKQ